MIDAMIAFQSAAAEGPGSPAYAAAVARFARLQVESLEDISSFLAVAATVIRAGHVETGTLMVEHAQEALELRVQRLRPPARS